MNWKPSSPTGQEEEMAERVRIKKQAIRKHWARRLVRGIHAKFSHERHVVDVDRCFACMSPWVPTEICHIKALSIGGTNDLNNLHLLCPKCHKASELLDSAAYWRWFDNPTHLSDIDDKATIAARTREALAAKRARGEYLGCTPLGYTRNPDGSLSINESEMRTVSRARELKMKGETLRSICEILTKEGHKPKRGGLWYPGNVSNMAKWWHATAVMRILKDRPADVAYSKQGSAA